MNIISIDTETTGLNPEEDEIIQFSSVDMQLNVLGDFLIKPMFHTSWKDAEKINGISPETVMDCPTILERKTEIERLLNRADLIVGYNIAFDLAFLTAESINVPDVQTLDVKKIFESVMNETASDGISLKWQSLIRCAEFYGYNWQGKPHGALSDAKATMFCFKKMFKLI